MNYFNILKHIKNLYDKLATALKASHFKATVELNSIVSLSLVRPCLCPCPHRSDLSFYNNDNADSSVYYNKKVVMHISAQWHIVKLSPIIAK